ncbi:hypothetical protein [Microbacterium sp. MYb45]|uniref:hypothetical protein n=1 Tax=Microbacterium sp. MYb45 TaxID=1827294 RepID=UPI0011B0BA0F|nr:hypothetical protein [Microbacterium sp. MYb45]
MSVSEQRSGVIRTRPHVGSRLVVPAVAAVLALLAGIATAAVLPDLTIRYLSFATMIAAVLSGVVAVRRGTAWVRAVSAIVAVLTLMLGSTFFGLTYS